MDANPKSHPDCQYSTNPFHECAFDCFDKIAQDRGKKHSSSKILNLAASFAKTKTETHSPEVYQSRPSPVAVKKKTKIPKANKSFTTLSSDEISIDINGEHDSLNQKEEKTLQMVPISSNCMSNRSKSVSSRPREHEHNSKNDLASESSVLNVASPTRSYINNDDENGVEFDTESVMSDSSVSVGKYNVRSSFYTILQSIIDKHGDIAANCKLESGLMRSRYLECLCSLIQELGSTPVGQLTKLKVKEMLAVLMDLESVNIDVEWLRLILEEFSQYQESADSEDEKQKELLRSKKEELVIQEMDLARLEKEVTEARLRVKEMRAELTKLEWLRMEEMGFKVEKSKGKWFLYELL